jgi:hypothetical protein
MAGYKGVMVIFESFHAVSSESVLRHLRILRNKAPDVLLVPSLLEDIVDTLELTEALVRVLGLLGKLFRLSTVI